MKSITCLTAVAALLYSTFANAQPEAPDVSGPADAPKDEVASMARSSLTEGTPGADSPLKVNLETGTSFTRGNTETFHLHTNLLFLAVPVEKWVFLTRGNLLYETSSGSTSANQWLASQRVDRFLTSFMALFAVGAVERNLFAGIDKRWSGQLGTSFLVIDHKDPTQEDLLLDRLTLEIGGYAALEERTLPPNAEPGAALQDDRIEIYAVRAAGGYDHRFRRATGFGLDAEFIQDVVETKNWVFVGTVYAQASLINAVALKVASSLRYDNLPAEATLEKYDLLVFGSLVITYEYQEKKPVPSPEMPPCVCPERPGGEKSPETQGDKAPAAAPEQPAGPQEQDTMPPGEKPQGEPQQPPELPSSDSESKQI